MIDLRCTARALLCVALGAAAPAVAQQGQVFPPVPGPFLVAGMAPVLAPPQATAPVPPGGPTFAAPANAMRMPYWMQPGQTSPAQQAATEPAEQAAAPQTPRTTAPGQGSAAVAATGYGQATTPGAFPGYAATIPWAAPAQQAPVGTPPGYVPAPQQGWGYGMPPGWAAPPYAPAPGWAQPGNGN